MLHKLIKSVLFPLSILPLIGSCSLFPKTKVIEYDEEVKLSDGSMIWVHIKRHYIQTGGREIPNLFQGYEKGWGAKEVEISWDTGFPNVGRKSEIFNDIAYFDFDAKKYFLIGPKDRNNAQYDILCGSIYGIMGYAVIYDEMGNCLKPKSWHDFPTEPFINIVTFKSIPDEWNDKKLSWQFKLSNKNLFTSFNEKITQKPFH